MSDERKNEPERKIVEAPTTNEGHYALHYAYEIDWAALRDLSEARRDEITQAAVEWLQHTRDRVDGSSAIYSLVGGKGDLFVFHLREDLDALNAAELDFKQLDINRYMTPTYSYVSVVELASHGDPQKRFEAQLRKRGLDPDSEEWSIALEALEEEHEEVLQQRLRPEIHSARYLCFYPMSKKRGESKNWYRLTARERGSLMRDHATVGRKYAGRVKQLVTGSIGFDDWEWGVTLYAADPLEFKKLIYEMRYDIASADYALFGPFYLGIRIDFEDLGELLDGKLPALADSPVSV